MSHPFKYRRRSETSIDSNSALDGRTLSLERDG
jgi:hypothetical protein